MEVERGLRQGGPMSLAKCCIYYGGIEQRVKEDIKKLIGFNEGALPFRYLGVPMSSKRLNVHSYGSLIEKIVHKITHWSSRLLTYAGRLLLLKNVTFTITQYGMQCLPFPKYMIQKINSICRVFLWLALVERAAKPR